MPTNLARMMSMATAELNTTWPKRMVPLAKGREGRDELSCLHEEDEGSDRYDDFGNDEDQVDDGVERRAQAAASSWPGPERRTTPARWR